MKIIEGKCEDHGYKVRDKKFKGPKIDSLDIKVTIWLN